MRASRSRFFEITTVAAFMAFAEFPADAVLLETGMGGRLDATNVIAKPAATAITRISYDHMQFLGDSIEAIAAEKAGILKPGVPAILGPQRGEQVAAVIAGAGRGHRRALVAPWPGLDGGGLRGWIFLELSRARAGPSKTCRCHPCPGRHQLGNAGTALACLELACLELAAAPRIDEAAVRRGLLTAQWPGAASQLRIRRFESPDRQGVMDLIAPNQREEFGVDITRDDQPDLAAIEDVYQVGQGGFWVAEANGHLVGTIGMKDIGASQAALRKMFGAPAYRGREGGVASGLLERLIAEARAGGVQEAFLGTTDKFVAAHRFYEKNGFAEIGRRLLPTNFPVMRVDTKFYRLGLVAAEA